MEEGNLRVLQLLEMKRNNGDVAAAPRKDAPTVRHSVFNPNKAYCLG